MYLDKQNIHNYNHSQTKPRLLDQVSIQIQTRHYSRKTEKTYRNWIKQFVLFHNKKHPRKMGESEVNHFLSYLATDRHVLNKELGDFGNVVRAKQSRKIPVGFTKDEVRRILTNLTCEKQLMASLLYGSGLRLTECLQLRVKDVDFDKKQIIVRAGKGEKDRAK